MEKISLVTDLTGVNINSNFRAASKLIQFVLDNQLILSDDDPM